MIPWCSSESMQEEEENWEGTSATGVWQNVGDWEDRISARS